MRTKPQQQAYVVKRRIKNSKLEVIKTWNMRDRAWQKFYHVLCGPLTAAEANLKLQTFISLENKTPPA